MHPKYIVKPVMLCLVLAPVAYPINVLMAQQKQTPTEQALGAKLMEEVGVNVQYRAALIEAQSKIVELQAQLDKRKAEDDEAKKKGAEAPSSKK